MALTQKQRGTKRERDGRDLLRRDGWVVTRAGGSIGAADLVALKAGERPQLVQVKASARSPFSDFPPAERGELLEVARRAGAVAMLLWWPYDGAGPRWYDEATWPDA